MTTYNKIAILQNGEEVTSVRPGSPLRLYADINTLTDPSLHKEFLVMGPGNIEYLRVYVGVSLWNGTCYYDWIAPSTEGEYTFYPDSADRQNYFKFSVSASTGSEIGGGTLFGLDNKTLLILALIAVGAIAIARH
jgi:hypothetical protein